MTEAIEAVARYLRGQSLGVDVWDARDDERSAHTFMVEQSGGGFLIVVASFEFLSATPPAAIPHRLYRWNLAARLRAAESSDLVMITSTGLQVGNRFR
jgi:hypothetical protein